MTPRPAHHATSGCELRSPLVASPSPLTGRPRRPARARGRRRRGGRAARRSSRSRSSTRRSTVHDGARAGRRELRRGDDLLPRLDDSQRGPDRVPRPRRGGQGGAVDPGDRAASTAPPPAAGCATPQLVQRPARTRSSSTSTRVAADPRRRRRTSSSDARSRGRRCERRVTIPLAVKVGPYFSAFAERRAPARRRRAPTGSSCSTASTSPTSTSRRSTVEAAARLSTPDGAPAAAALDRDPARPRRGDLAATAASTPPRTSSSCSSPARTP